MREGRAQQLHRASAPTRTEPRSTRVSDTSATIAISDVSSPPTTIFVANVCWMPSKISVPSPPALTYPAIVAIPITVTVAIRSPATITGVASGSSTRVRSRHGPKPMPRAASTMSGGTSRMPVAVLRIRISRE